LKQFSVGARLAGIGAMSALDNIYQKMVPTLEAGAFAQLHQDVPPGDPQSQIGREVAHELNNILTVIQGYADRLVMKYGDNPVLRHDLQLISDNSRRAVATIKKARGVTPRPKAPEPVPAAVA
jgi:signal transduction histidine kinase